MSGGRLSSELAKVLKEKIASGGHQPGNFLPSLRQLATDHSVAYVTVVRAMKLLEKEGVVEAEPRRGYRALSLANDPLRGCPVAMIAGRDLKDPSRWDLLHRALLMGLQDAAMQKGWPTLGVTFEGREPKDVVEQLKAARVVGVAVDCISPGLIDALRHARIPTVLIDAWDEDLGMDGVVQDNYSGAFAAGRYLLDRGCRNIAWVGLPVDDSVHSRERFGGAAAALQAGGRPLAGKNIVEIQPDSDPLPVMRALLGRKARPDGVVAPWQDAALAARQAAEEVGLVVGRDLHLVGWTLDEAYDSQYAPRFSDPAAAAAMVWSAATMAATALRRLMERRSHPELPPLRINVPVRLRTAGKR